MKSKYFSFYTLLMVLFLTGSASADKSPWDIKLPFETAIISYEITGNSKGTETLYIRGSGAEQSAIRKTSGKVLFMPVTTDTMHITNPEYVIEIDMEKSLAKKYINPTKFLNEEYAALPAKDKEIVQKNAVSVGTNLSQMMGAKVQRKAGEHLGYQCDVVTMMGFTSCVMCEGGIVLKFEGSLLGMEENNVATKIDKNAAVSGNVFEIPAGVKVEHDYEADKSNREMAKVIIETLKDPNAAKSIEKEAESQKR